MQRLHVLNLLTQPRRSQVNASTHCPLFLVSHGFESLNLFCSSFSSKGSLVETKVVVVKTEHEASASSAAKEVPVARPPITVEEEKYVVEKTQLEAIASQHLCVLVQGTCITCPSGRINAFFVNLHDGEVTFEGYSMHFGTAEAARWFLNHELQTIRRDNCLVADGLGAGRSRRDRKPVRYTFGKVIELVENS
ncbi:hypothetical protein Bca52824_062460 [Brassica carinata]|uniref:Uncharacterized protein n=1 Tax=Brassica carinata TaxID=52824 RepID=A0A8X7QCX6_BRACI|nr:hypothetical protein Bca52824_062460 [Brassica carinata]